MASKPICVRRAGTVEEADIIVAWLNEQGVEASVLDHDSPGLLAFGVTDVEGVEIYVPDEDSAERAKVLLAEHDRTHAAEAIGSDLEEQVTTKCEECGQVNSFPADLQGSVQECADCGAHLDVR